MKLTEILFETAQDSALEKFKRMHGADKLQWRATDGVNEAPIGLLPFKSFKYSASGAKKEKNEEAYIVFYPDGTTDRFDGGDKVVYRDGYKGPVLPQKTPKREVLPDSERMQRQWAEEKRKIQKANEHDKKRQDKIYDLSAKAQRITIPPHLKLLMREAESWFYKVANAILPDMGGEGFETPEEAFSAIFDSGVFQQYSGCTEDDMKELSSLDKKYQNYLGSFYTGKL